MNTFNAATFLDVTQMSDRAVQRLGHADDVPSQAPRTFHRPLSCDPRVALLRAAASHFERRGQTRNADTCLDLSSKLERFGSFVSEKQAGYADQLIRWAGVAQEAAQAAPGAPAAPQQLPTPPAAPAVRLEALHAVMQKHAKFYVGGLTLARKQGDQLVWIKHADAEKVVGKIDNGVLTLWSRQGVDMDDVRDLLQELNADPLAAARKYGKLSGRCCSCGADLVDPESIERGQGPVCMGKF